MFRVGLDLLVPRSRLKKKGDRVFASAGPKLWNSFPVSIRTIPTEPLFKTRLKAYLFERAFNVCLLFQIIICLFYFYSPTLHEQQRPF